jgi:hypothetical protein
MNNLLALTYRAHRSMAGHARCRCIGFPNLGRGCVGADGSIHLRRPTEACVANPPIRQSARTKTDSPGQDGSAPWDALRPQVRYMYAEYYFGGRSFEEVVDISSILSRTHLGLSFLPPLSLSLSPPLSERASVAPGASPPPLRPLCR